MSLFLTSRPRNLVGAAVLLAVLLTALLTNLSHAGPSGPLHRVADIPLPGDTSRFDYESLDPQSGRLAIAHLGAGTVVIVDARAGRVLGEVPGVSQVHGVLSVPARHRLYASATGTGQVAVIDLDRRRVLAEIPAGVYPDGLAYDPVNENLYVSDESGGTDSVISTRTNRNIATIPLGGHIGNTQYDPVSGLIMVAVGAPAQLCLIDPQTNRLVRCVPLPGADSPHGLLLDAPNRLAFVACEGNSRLLTVSLKTMQVTQNQKVGSDPDVLAFDPGLRRLYVASEEGPLAVFQEQAGGLTRLGDIAVGENAHSVAVDPQTHRVYLPLKDEGGRPVLRVMAP